MPPRSVEHATFALERRYPVAPARVFGAWADPAAKAAWFGGPEDWERDGHALDFRVGGREESAGGPRGGPVHAYRAVYWDIVEDERIVYTYEMLVDGVRVSVSQTTVELVPDGGGTRLRLTEQAAFLDGSEHLPDRAGGLGSLLDALGRELGGGRAGPPRR